MSRPPAAAPSREGQEAPAMRRILVALDGDESARVALEAAAGLAAALEAELVGLFIEDTELLEAADLPVTWSIPRVSGPRGALDSLAMGRALKVSALEAGRAVAAAARRHHLPWSFEVRRGAMVEQVLNEARGFDLLAMGASCEAMRRTGVEVTGGLMAMPGPGALLLARGTRCSSGPLVALYKDSERVLALAQRLAALQRRRLVIVAAGASAADASVRHEHALQRLRLAGLRGSARKLVMDRPDAVGAALRLEYPGILLLDRRDDIVAGLSLASLAREAACSLLVLK